MTQNELVWLLMSVIQIGIVSFVGYWTRRVTRLEDTMGSVTMDYQGRLSRLEAQYTEIIRTLGRIERKLEQRSDNDREEGE